MLTELLDHFRTWLHATAIGQIPLLERCILQIVDLFIGPFTGSGRFHWVALVAGLALAAFVYWAGRQVRPSGGWRGFVKYCFPKELYRHPSSMVDCQLTVLNACFGYLFNLTWRINGVFFTGLFTGCLTWAFGPPAHALEWTAGWLIAVTVLVFLASDLASWTFHYLSHRIPFLWALHRVHHSAEVLTPITATRTHPLEYALTASFRAAFTSAVLAPVLYLFAGPPAPLEMFGIAAFVVLTGMLGDLLMHSHVWLSWGRTLNHVFFCPAMHQIHHSQAPKHWDRNFAATFAIWDWMFGTIYVPDEPEKITYGIHGETGQPFPNALAAWVLPYWDMIPPRGRLADLGTRVFGQRIRGAAGKQALAGRPAPRMPSAEP